MEFPRGGTQFLELPGVKFNLSGISEGKVANFQVLLSKKYVLNHPPPPLPPTHTHISLPLWNLSPTAQSKLLQ